MAPHEFLCSAKILIVDDDEDTLSLDRTVLRTAGYSNILTALDSRQVLAHFVEEDPDIIILDVLMPHLNGFQLLEILQRSIPEGLSLPVLMMTALPTPEMRHMALVRGAVDLIAKPFPAEDFVLRVRNLLNIRLAFRDVQQQNQVLFAELLNRAEEVADYQLELNEAQLEVIARLAHAGEQRDDQTGKHTQRVAVTSGLIAHGLGFCAGKVEVLQRAAPLHDVGKIGVPDSILLKPGRLTPEEICSMQGHCGMGSDLLSGGRSEILQLAEDIALSHHEKWDGRGYPLGLKGESIPIEGRILAVADVFDALTHERPYKKAWPVKEAVAEIQIQSGKQFDPQVVEAFMMLRHEELV